MLQFEKMQLELLRYLRRHLLVCPLLAAMSTLLAPCHGLPGESGKIIPGVCKSPDGLRLAQVFAANLADCHALVQDTTRFDDTEHRDRTV